MIREFDTEGFDSESFGNTIDAANESIEKQEAVQDQLDREALAEEEEAAKPKEKDPKDFGVVDNIQEAGEAVVGAGVDMVADTLSLPQRLYDMARGENKDESEYDYLGIKGAIKTETKWGQFVRSALGIVAPVGIGGKIAKGSKLLQGAMAAGQAGKLGALGRVATSSNIVGQAVRGGVIGESVMFLKPTQQENLFNELKNMNPAFEGLAIQEGDHPLAMKLKNMGEGFSIGFLADLGLGAMGRQLAKAKRLPPANKADKAMDNIRKTSEPTAPKNREADIDDQVVERGVMQLEDQEMGGFKDKPVADPGQGAPISKGQSFDIYDQLNQIDSDWRASAGSTDGLLTSAQLARANTGPGEAREVLREVAKEVMGDVRTRRLISEATDVDDLDNRMLYAIRRVSEFAGRDKASDEFWKPMYEQLKVVYDGDEIVAKAWVADNVLTADLVIGSLAKEIRDIAEVGLEVADDIDVRARDSIIDNIKERMKTGLIEVKKTRFLWGDEGRSLNMMNDPKVKGDLSTKKVEEIEKQVSESLDLMIDVIQKAPNDNVARAYMEAFSIGDIRNYEDLDNYMRRVLVKGSEYKPSVLLRQLQDVMTNSILSGPKTVVRAILGTGSAVFLRPMATALGGALSGDFTTARASLAAANGLVQAIPESFKLFRKKLSGYMSGDIATVRNRYSETTQGDVQWEMFGDWVDTRGSTGDKAAYRIANMARALNDNSLFTYSPKAMAAGDDAFSLMMARSRAREKAFLKAQEGLSSGDISEITPAVMKKYEDALFNELYDSDGTIKESFLKNSYKESTLTTDLSGFSAKMENLMNSNPWTKPFFLFARTGVNGLALTSKYTPGLNLLLEEQQAILKATANNLETVQKYGIQNEMDLKNAKALMKGRMAIGSAVVFMVSQKFMNGELRGNGPPDRQRRKLWRDLGGDEYSPRQIKIGDVWVGYDNIEPFGTIMTTIADIGDYSESMGEEWTKDQFQKVSMIIGQAVTSKSYLQGLGQLVDMVSGEPAGFSRTVAGLVNNTVPLGGLRNEMGKLFSPYLKELNNDIFSQVRARNQITENLTDKPLAIKYDMLTGKPIQEWNFVNRMINSVNVFSMNMDMTPGRKLLFESQYDLANSVMTAPDSTDLSEYPEVRSLFMKKMGEQNLLAKLDALAKRKDVQASMAKMKKDIDSPFRGEYDAMDYPHNLLIKKLMTKARKKAWNDIKDSPELADLRERDKQLRRAALYTRKKKYDEADAAAQSALNLKNK